MDATQQRRRHRAHHWPIGGIDMRGVRTALLAAAVIGAAGVTGCATPMVERPEPADITVSADGRFDRAASEARLAEAQALRETGDVAAAAVAFREAALLWPETVDAWIGLQEAAFRLGDAEEAGAAGFAAGRVRLYDGRDLFVQREVTRALRRFTADTETRGITETERTYAAALADYYTFRYSGRGVYEPPSEILNVEARELPAVLATGVAAGIYGTVLAGSDADGD